MADANQDDQDLLKKKFDERWAERQKSRLDLADKRHQNKAEATLLLNYLEEWIGNIKKSIDDAQDGNLDPSKDMVEITSVLDEIVTDISNFEKYFNENNKVVQSNYDVRQIQLKLTDVRANYVTLQNLLQPKKKFGFKSKFKSGTKAPAKTEATVKRKSEVALDASSFIISKERLEVEEGDVLDRDVIVDNLSNCTVKLFGNPSTVHATNLNNVTLLCGPVKTSVFVSNCKKCTFVMACQQVRTHTTADCDFYIHVVAKAIVEDCKNVRFAPYNLSYPALEAHYEKSGLNRDSNSWDKVDDFNWLSSAKPSPNWTLIPENERKSDHV